MIHYKYKKCGNEFNSISACTVCGSNIIQKIERYKHLILKAEKGRKVTFFKSGTFSKFQAMKFGEAGRAVGAEQFKIILDGEVFRIQQGNNFKEPTLLNENELGSNPIEINNGDNIKIVDLILTSEIEDKNEVIEDIEV